MASIVLKTFKGGNVSPLNDAIMWQTSIPGAGIFKGCEVTAARGNILHLSQGYGIIKGRFFEMYENEQTVQLAETGQTLNGRVYLHMDLSNADEPIKIIAETGESFSSLLTDPNVNYNNSSYDLELATFKADVGGILDLTNVSPAIEAGGGGGGGNGSAGLSRDTSYEEGDIVTCANAPGWSILVCVQRGTTALIEPIGYTQILKSGDKVLDGGCVFMARDLIAELDDITHLSDEVSDITDILDAMRSDTSSVSVKLMSLDDYKALETYNGNTIYYCYTDEETRQITAIYIGEHTFYATKVEVNYHIDTDDVITKNLLFGEDAISEAPTASISGYTFVGWRADDEANKKVLSEKTIDSEEMLDLYAVFSYEVTATFDANGGEGEADPVTAPAYYNNGNEGAASIKTPKRGFSKEDFVFAAWTVGSVGGVQVKKGGTAQIITDMTIFAAWSKEKFEFGYKGETEEFYPPVTGLYRISVWGAQGGNAKDSGGTIKAKGGKGGHSEGYAILKRNVGISIAVGGKGKDPNTNNQTQGGFNGGGYCTYASSNNCGGGGGGCTHVASIGGTLKDIGKAKMDKVFIIAGGGGGGTYYKSDNFSADGGYGGGEYGGNGKSCSATPTTGKGGDPSTFATDSPRVGFGEDCKSNNAAGGGGGGYIGGGTGSPAYNTSTGGGGGCGFIGNVPEITLGGISYPPFTEGNIQEGDGKCEIDFIEAT